MRTYVAAVLLAAGLACLSTAGSAAAQRPVAPGVTQLSGVLHLTKGTCAGNQPKGSYLSVTFGTRAITNSASTCEGGAVTLLSPGRDGLSTVGFSPASDEAFDGHRDAVASSITEPTAFDGHRLSLVSAAADLQDAPAGPATFALPHLYVAAGRVLADVRSVQALYDGVAGATCASGGGSGCWLIGAQRATGTFDARTRRMTLTWFCGQSFVSQSAGTAVHLSGVFEGAPKTVKQGQTVDLGTASFAAGPPSRITAAGTSTNRTSAQAPAQPTTTALAAPYDSPLTRAVRSPLALTAAALLVGVDALLFAGAVGRRTR